MRPARPRGSNSTCFDTFLTTNSSGPIDQAALEGPGGFTLNEARARGAAAWLHTLSQPWVASLRDPRRRRAPHLFVGCRVLSYIAGQVQHLWRLRRRLLRAVPAYKSRALDPGRGGPAVARARMGHKGLAHRIMMALFFFLICIVVISFIAFVLETFSSVEDFIFFFCRVHE